MLKSLISAFLMYSRIPMPQIGWTEENRRYALCWFPMIGLVNGGLLLGWYWLAAQFSLSSLLFGVIAVCIPLLVTGGIHLDGFCDVEDARASCAEKSRKLEIMSDPHIGSFAVMHLVLYLLKLAQGLATDALRGRVGRDELRVLRLQGLEPLHEHVELIVRNDRRVLDIVESAVIFQLPTELVDLGLYVHVQSPHCCIFM